MVEVDTTSAAGRSGAVRWVRRAGVILVVLGIVVVIYSATSMFWSVREVRGDVERVTTAVQAGEVDEAFTAVADLVASSGELASVTGSGTWKLAQQLPVVGASIQGLNVMAQAVNSMAAAAEPIAASIAGANSTTGKIAALGDAERDLRTLAEAMGASYLALQSVDPAELRFGLDEQARDLLVALPAATDLVTATADAADVLPGLLGMQGRRTWLVLLQNPAEARGSGGLFSGYALVEVVDGEPTILKAETRKTALDDVDLPYRSVVSADSAQLWGEFLGRWASFNLSADFPEVAALAYAGMAARGTPVDGVIALDAYAVQALLRGTGKVEHRGVEIDGTNAGDFFTRELYAQFPDFDSVEAKDELALGLVYATINAVLRRPLDFPTLVDSVPGVVSTGHIKAWSPQPMEQAWFTEIGVAGDIASLDPSTIVIGFNNAVGGKLDAYLTPEITLERGLCWVDGRTREDYQLSVLTVALRNDAPSGLPDYVDVRLDDPTAPRGSTRMLVHVYGPEDSAIEDVIVNGEFGDLVAGREAGRPVWGSQMEIFQGETASVTFVFVEPRDSTDPGNVVVPGTAIPATVQKVFVGGGQRCPDFVLDHPPVAALFSGEFDAEVSSDA